MTVKIVLHEKKNLQGHTLIEAFPGIGLVGTIAAGYLIEKRKMEPIGHIESDEFPPMTTIHNGVPLFPARIYHDPKDKFCILLSEFVVPSKSIYDLSESILDFAEKNKIKQVISLAGMTPAEGPSEGSDKVNVFAVGATKADRDQIKKAGLEPINEGITTGVSGVLISKAAAKHFPVINILAESGALPKSTGGFFDPRASAALLDGLGRLAGLKVDLKDLLSEAEKIEKNIKQLLQRAQSEKKKYRDVEELTHTPMYT